MRDTKKIGKIVKGVGGKYTVYCDGVKCVCYARKKVKYFYDDIVVGDDVEFEQDGKICAINKILPRKNFLKRPAVSNVDAVFAIVSSLPAPDFLLIDKIIANCNKQGVALDLVINKTDIVPDKFFIDAQEQYADLVNGIITVSTFTGEGISTLKAAIAGKTVCFAGQSAVGKTSILNALLPNLNKPTGELSSKTDRGKHTTRHNEIYPLKDGGFVVDTAGFSLYELTDVESDQLALYYDDLYALLKDCRFNMCTHTTEPDCAVKKAVEQGKLSKRRYDRYVELYNELRRQEKEKF